MKPLKRLCLLIAVSALSACASSMMPSRLPTPQQSVPASLQKLCPPINAVNTDDWDVLAGAYLKLILDYGECAARVQKQGEALIGVSDGQR